MNIDELTKRAGAGDLAPVYLLFGPEQYLVGRYQTALIDAVLGDGPRDFNLDRLDARACTGEELVQMARSLPMMAGARVVLIREAESLKAKALERLVDYLEDPSPSTALVLSAAKVDFRKKAFSRMKKVGVVVECKRLRANELAPWIRRMAQEDGKKIDPKAVSALVQLVGADLARLGSEVRKVCLYAGDGDVRVEHVHAVVADIREERIFELTDAVAGRQAAEALRILAKLCDAGEQPLGILGMIGRHVRILTMARDAASRGHKAADVLRSLGVMPFLVDKYVRQMHGFGPEALTRAYLTVRETDYALKSSKMPDRTHLENLVLDLCALGAGDRNARAAGASG